MWTTIISFFFNKTTALIAAIGMALLYVWFLHHDVTRLKGIVAADKIALSAAAKDNTADVASIKTLQAANAAWASQHQLDLTTADALKASLTKQDEAYDASLAVLQAQELKDKDTNGTLQKSLDDCCSELARRLRLEAGSIN